MHARWVGAAMAAALFTFAPGAGVVQAAPVEAYGKLPTIEPGQFALSPAGDRIAFVATAKGGAARQLVVRELTGKTLMAANISKNKVRYLRWAGETHVLLGTSATLNNLDSAQSAIEEVFQVVVLNLDTGKNFAVFDRQPKIWPQVIDDYGVFETGGKWFGYYGGITMGGSGNSVVDFSKVTSQTAYFPDHWYTDVYRVNLDTGAHEKVSGGSNTLAGRALGPGGEIVAHSQYDQPTGKWMLFAGAGGDHKVMEQMSKLHDIGLSGLGRQPGTVVVTSNDTDNTGVYEFDLAHGDARTELLKGEFVDELRHDRNGRLVAAVVERDVPVTVFLDPALQAAFARASKPFGGKATFISADDSWTRWILLTEGDGDSGTYYLVDLNKGTAEVIATMYPDIDTPDVGPVRMIAYKAADGLALQGVLTLPPGKAEAKNLPVVILPHGGPEGHDSPHFDWLAQAFASQGYAVFQPNFRGSDGGSTALRDAGWGEWGRKMQTDLSEGLAELARRGFVDPKRACIVGASYGGYAALAGVTVQQGLYRCAVSYGGVADLNNMLRWETDRGGQQTASFRYWKKFMGARSEGDSSLREISPAALAAKADAPILLIHGKNDSVVPIDQSRTMAGALRARGKPVEVLELDGEDHWLSSEATRVQMIKAAVEFVKKNNPPG
jgi:dipeptidyl aminopeptidase/acylaminoacyl peptidase